MEKYTEFEEMRVQLALLNKKLQQENIVNERLMRRIMKDKASFIRRKAIIESVVIIGMIPFYLWMMPQLTGLSMRLCIFTAFFMVLALGYNYYIHSHFNPQEFIHGNLIKARKDTLRMKKLYANWIKFIGIPFIIVFLSWFIYETMHLYQGEELQCVMTGIIVGIVIGGCIGICQFLKIQRNADDILAQIEELSDD